MRPWHFIVSFGLVSLFADMVYESARSTIGPSLATLGASSFLVQAISSAMRASMSSRAPSPGVGSMGRVASQRDGRAHHHGAVLR